MNMENKNKYCSVSGCKGCMKEDGISLHLAPLDKTVYNKWCIALKVKMLSRKAIVCSKHFCPEDYYPAANGKRKCLKKGAVPTQYLPISLLTSVSKDPELAERRKNRLIERNVKKLKLLDEKHKQCKDFNDSNEEEGAAVEDDSIDTCVNKTDDQTNTDSITDQTNSNPLVDVLLVEDNSINLPVTSDEVDVRADKSVQMATVNNNQERKIKTSILDFLDDDAKLLTYISIKSFKILDTLVECISDLRKVKKKKVISMSIRDSVLLTFLKLKQNQSYSAIGILFHTDYRTSKRCFINTLIELVKVLSHLVRWPGKKEILNNMPKCFSKYKSTRVVFDYLEITIRQSKCLKCRIPTYSNYKSPHTVKFLIDVTPSGMISYISKGYGGRTSDKCIFNRSNLLNRMIRCVDAIMVDGGFLIDQECAEYGIKLIRPPFLKKNKQLSGNQAIMNADIAAARVHVERRIQRLRLYKILQGPLETEIVPYIRVIIKVICAMTNLDSPILSGDKCICSH